MSSPLNYGTPSSLSTPRSLLRGAMTPARHRADLRGHHTAQTVPAPTPTRRVRFLLSYSTFKVPNMFKDFTFIKN